MKSDPIPMTRRAVTIAMQFAAGLFLAALLAGLVSVVFVLFIGGDTSNFAVSDYWAAIGFGVGLTLGASFGVYMVGALLEKVGFTRQRVVPISLFARFVTTIGGAILGLFITQITQSAGIVLFSLVMLGALGGYYFYDLMPGFQDEKKRD
jgi:hypothetical protein